MQKKPWHTLVVRFALLLFVTIGSVGISSYIHESAHAATQPITRTENDPEMSTMVIDAESDMDAGIVAPFYFSIQSSITYTLDEPVAWQPPLVQSGSDSFPVIRNIKQDVYVVGGNDPNLPFGLTVSSSVEVYSGDGILLQTITGNPASTIRSASDIDYALQDFTRIPATTPYQPYSNDFVGPRNPTTFFTLKHIIRVVADSGYQVNPSQSFTHNVQSF